jgi:hypothetical protein
MKDGFMIRTSFLILASVAALCAAEKPAGAANGAAARNASAPKPAAKAPPANVLPSGAVSIGPDTWRHTDAEGRKWIYRKTPFALVRYEEAQEAGVPPLISEKELASIKATEEGDTVRFERAGPFGPQRWSRKKSELDAIEKLALERSRSGAARAAGKQE